MAWDGQWLKWLAGLGLGNAVLGCAGEASPMGLTGHCRVLPGSMSKALPICGLLWPGFRLQWQSSSDQRAYYGQTETQFRRRFWQAMLFFGMGRVFLCRSSTGPLSYSTR